MKTAEAIKNMNITKTLRQMLHLIGETPEVSLVPKAEFFRQARKLTSPCMKRTISKLNFQQCAS